MTDDRIPVELWIDAHLRDLNARGVSYYIVQKGNHASGTILLKLVASKADCRLLIQQRDFEGVLGWISALPQETVEEAKADDYIRRSVARDPDLWVIEIEDKEKKNPFEGKVL